MLNLSQTRNKAILPYIYYTYIYYTIIFLLESILRNS